MDDPTVSPLSNHPTLRTPSSSSSVLLSSCSSSSLLNLPPNMSRSSLDLETLTPSRHINCMINSNHYQSPSTTTYSDRFIPSRSGSNFALFNISTPTNSHGDGGREDHSSAYATLLRSAPFGPDAGVVPPVTPEKRSLPMSPPSRNIFRYKTETRRSMHSLSPFGFDDNVPGVNLISLKTPRKVPRFWMQLHCKTISI